MTVRAMKDGAVEFLTKPFRDQELLDAILLGLERARQARARAQRRHGLRRCRYRGPSGMQRWIGLGVIANDLLVLARAGP
jgi:FixJ family two-component response regulator